MFSESLEVLFIYIITSVIIAKMTITNTIVLCFNKPHLHLVFAQEYVDYGTLESFASHRQNPIT